jgi:hypothetical protein
MMRFVLCLAVAVCSVVQAEEFPFVSGEVKFAPVATVGDDPLYWDLGQGQGLVFGSASLQSFRQDGWTVQLQDRNPDASLGQTSVQWLTSGVHVSAGVYSVPYFRAFLQTGYPLGRQRAVMSVDYHYDGNPVVIYLNGRPVRLPGRTDYHTCNSGVIANGWAGTASVLVPSVYVAQVMVIGSAGADIVIGNPRFDF